MLRPTSGVGHQPALWLLFILRLRKFVRLKYLIILFFFLILFTYVRVIHHAPSDHLFDEKISTIKTGKVIPHIEENQHISDKCNFDETEFILRYKPKSVANDGIDGIDDTRPEPTADRLYKLFSILISHEEKYRKALDYLEIFRFNDLANTLRPFANNTQRLHEIYCLFQRYITISDNGHIDVSPQLIDYLQHVSDYLSDGFKNEHSTWSKTSGKIVQKPVIILGANSRFFDNLQASMRTVNEHFKDHAVVVYDLGFTAYQLTMIKENCERCMIISFPFDEIAPASPHVRNLPNFAWKPIIVQDAVRRFGTIIYGDTSVRYLTSNFDRIIIDNLIRGFACRELPGHYLSCFTLQGTFSWFNESSSIFDDVYIAEAGFVAVTDNFLSRLVLKTWVTCALDPDCISPPNSKTQCKGGGPSNGAHRFDQSAMVTVLSFYFFQSSRKNGLTDPAPYDMFASIQQKVAEVRRFEGDNSYFTERKKFGNNKNSPTTTTTQRPL